MIDWILKWFPIIFGIGVVAALGGYATIGILHLRRDRQKRRIRSVLLSMKHDISATILDPILPMERGRKYEEPLGQALEAQELGVITGGGTQLDKGGSVQSVDIEIAVEDLGTALQLVRERLQQLGAPPGSFLKYREGDQDVTLPIA